MKFIYAFAIAILALPALAGTIKIESLDAGVAERSPVGIQVGRSLVLDLSTCPL